MFFPNNIVLLNLYVIWAKKNSWSIKCNLKYYLAIDFNTSYYICNIFYTLCISHCSTIIMMAGALFSTLIHVAWCFFRCFSNQQYKRIFIAMLLRPSLVVTRWFHFITTCSGSPPSCYVYLWVLKLFWSLVVLDLNYWCKRMSRVEDMRVMVTWDDNFVLKNSVVNLTVLTKVRFNTVSNCMGLTKKWWFSRHNVKIENKPEDYHGTQSWHTV